MFVCPICQYSSYRKASFSNHIAKVHKDISTIDRETIKANVFYGTEAKDALVEQYKNEKLCFSELPGEIQKIINHMGIKRTHTEEKLTERYKNKIQNTLQQKYGPGIINPSQVKSVQEKSKQSYIKRYGTIEEYHKVKSEQLQKGLKAIYANAELVKEIWAKIENTCLERYGHKNFGNGDEARKKSKIKYAQTVSSWSKEEKQKRTEEARKVITNRGGGLSKPEKKIRNALTELGIDFSPNVFLFGYSWDMLLNNKILIEVQGTMWHAFPGKYKENDVIMGKLKVKDIWEKDARKKIIASQNGYKVVYFWEHEINKCSDENLVSLVKERLENECTN